MEIVENDSIQYVILKDPFIRSVHLLVMGCECESLYALGKLVPKAYEG